jgi:beta-N-acetylhexosaminidase
MESPQRLSNPWFALLEVIWRHLNFKAHKNPLIVVKYKNPCLLMSKKVLLSVLLFFSISSIFAQDRKIFWVDSVFQTLSPEDKIGQLFMLPVSSSASPHEIDELTRELKDHHVGGLFVTGGSPMAHALLINTLQQQANVPLLLAMNAEWGVGQTLDSTICFPKPLMLGAITDDTLIYNMGKEIGRQMKLLGIHINFAPQTEIEFDQQNKEEALLHYSSDKALSTIKSMALIMGLQKNGIMITTKLIDQKRSNGDSLSLPDPTGLTTLDSSPYPFMIGEGVQGLLTSKLSFSVTDKKETTPASVSKLFVDDVLKKKYGFSGLLFTDISDVQKLAGKNKNTSPEELAFVAQHDILLNPQNTNQAIREILRSIKKDRTLGMQLDASVKKILAVKFDAGLAERKRIETDNLLSRLNSPEARLLNHQLIEAAITVARNNESLVPLFSLEDEQLTSLSIGSDGKTEFNHYLSKYTTVKKISIQVLSDTTGLKRKIESHGTVIISIYPSALSSSKEISIFIRTLAIDHKIILCHFGNVFDLKDFEGVASMIAGYTDDDLVQKITAQIIFGGMPGQGMLPVTVSASLPVGKTAPTSKIDRFSYTLPEAAGVDSKTLEKIKVITNEIITQGATPGCVVFVAKDGKVILEETDGWFTYDKQTPVSDSSIYDLASVTKVSATLQGTMFLYEKGLIDINKKASFYLPELKGTNKKDYTLKDILTHQAGLWPFLPFWAQTVKDGKPLPEYYSTTESEDYPFPVSEGLFASKSMKDSLWQWIIKARVRDKPIRTPYTYTYSDMGFYIMQHIVEKFTNQPIQDFLTQNFYEPLGASTLGFLPLKRFPSRQIAPTENDLLFRKSLLIGYVHDQGAAMHGGVAGHAGLFSNANDLAKLYQMLLQKGRYGGVRYFKPETVDFFTNKQFEKSRRGLGWDKPTLNDTNGSTSRYSSAKTFGHTGFTGTCVWVDPEFNLVYVFLSNRVNPIAENNKLINDNVRPRIHDVIYEAIFNFQQYKEIEPNDPKVGLNQLKPLNRAEN